MFGFERELLNRTFTAAAIAERDGFSCTAAALVAVAKDFYTESAARSARSKAGEISPMLTKSGDKRPQTKLTNC